MACSSLGSRPDNAKKDKILKSKNYSKEEDRFINRRQDKLDEMRKNMSSIDLLKSWFKNKNESTPTKKLPEVKPNLDEFLAQSDDLKVIWFGHSTFLLNVDGKIVLVDPVFSNNASPVSFLVKRFQKPILSLEELPSIDYILISHDHYDHLDMESVKFFVDKKTTFIVPLGVDAHLMGWGVAESNIIANDWWDETSFDGIKFIATPSQHFSGRSIHQNETLWASWVIQSENHNIYFSGDSGFDSHFKDIGDKYGPFDIAFLENGQYNEKWKEVHMMPEEAVQAYKDLRAKKYFPIHWGMFELSLHSWFDPIETIYKFSQEEHFPLVAPKIGEIVNTSEEFKVEKWWSL